MGDPDYPGSITAELFLKDPQLYWEMYPEGIEYLVEKIIHRINMPTYKKMMGRVGKKIPLGHGLFLDGGPSLRAIESNLKRINQCCEVLKKYKELKWQKKKRK